MYLIPPPIDGSTFAPDLTITNGTGGLGASGARAQRFKFRRNDD